MKHRTNMLRYVSMLPMILIILVLANLPSHAENLDQLVAEALRNNSQLSAAKARWEGSTYKAPQVGSLKDPVFSFALSNYPSDSLGNDETPMTGNEVKLAQMFPFPGKLENRSALADEQARWFEAVFYDMHYQVARKVKDAWYRFYYVSQASKVTDRNLALVDDIIRLTEVRYETGSGLQQDVLRAQVQRSKFMERLMALQQQSTTIQAELNRLLSRPAETTYEPPKELELLTVDKGLAEFLASGQKARPLNQAYQSLIKRFRHQKKLADLEDYPDVTLWGSWRFRDDGLPDGGTDFVSAGVSFNLPVYKARTRAAAAEAMAAIRMAESQKLSFQNELAESILKAHARMAETYQQAVLYREGIIPQTNQSFQATLGSYQVGKVAFISLLDTLMATFKAELEYYRVSSEYMRSLAWLEAESALPLTGVPIHTNTQNFAEFVKHDLPIGAGEKHEY